MATKGTVSHSGRVLSVFRDTVTVAVESTEACGSCASRSACSLGVQSNTRNILVVTPEAHLYSVGEVVTVTTRTQMGLTAVALCYFAPMVTLVVALAVAVGAGVNEGVSALISLAAVGLYYAVLWLLKDKLAKKISFTIQKQ